MATIKGTIVNVFGTKRFKATDEGQAIALYRVTGKSTLGKTEVMGLNALGVTVVYDNSATPDAEVRASELS